jgi:hypothetical protein
MNQSMTRMDSHKNKNNKYSTVNGQSEILYQKRVKERILNTSLSRDAHAIINNKTNNKKKKLTIENIK